METDEIEADLYFAYRALIQIDSLLSLQNVDSASIVVEDALAGLGKYRYYRDSDFVTDVLTFRSVFIGHGAAEYREVLKQEYSEKIGAFYREIERN